jgi:hypothetical protein
VAYTQKKPTPLLGGTNAEWLLHALCKSYKSTIFKMEGQGMYECTHVCFSKLSRKEGRGNKYASNSVKSYYLDTFAELQGYSSWQQNRALLLLVRLNEAHFCRSVATQEPKQSYPEMKPFVETLDYSLLTQDPNLPEIQKKNTHTHLRGIEKRDTRTWFWRGHHGLRILIGAEKIIERKSNFF